MNRLVIIGNGFDLAHGLKTSNADFIDWYWDNRMLGVNSAHTDVSEDILCSFSIRSKNEHERVTWNVLAYTK